MSSASTDFVGEKSVAVESDCRRRGGPYVWIPKIGSQGAGSYECAFGSGADEISISLVKAAVEVGKDIYATHQRYKAAKAPGAAASAGSTSGAGVSGAAKAEDTAAAAREYQEALLGLVPARYNSDTENAQFGTLDLRTIGVYYSGVFVDGELEGFGEMRTPVFVYTGSFLHGLPHGEGKMFYVQHGATFVGEFVKGERHGHGQLTSESGTLLSGTFENNLLVSGTIVTARRGIVFNGTIANNSPVEGKLEYPSGTVYVGRVMDWKWDDDTGCATLKFPPKNKETGAPYKAQMYKGQFKDGKYSGQGQMTYRSGRCWTGTWVASTMGEGVWSGDLTDKADMPDSKPPESE
jgi:hypothetical protein